MSEEKGKGKSGPTIHITNENESLSQDEVDKVTERMYSVSEIAELWGFSTPTIRKLFENEPGILYFGEPRAHKAGRRYRRKYMVMRIPRSVLERVYQRVLLHKGPTGSPRFGARDGSIGGAALHAS
jgi:hypothetical protein